MTDIPAKTVVSAHSRFRFLNQPLAVKGLIVIALPLACLLIALGSVFLADRESRKAENYVRVTFAIQQDILELHALLAEGASGVRGYLLTRDETFLAPYKKAVTELPAVFAAMRPLIIDAEQLERLNRMEPLVDKKLKGLASLMQGSVSNNQIPEALRQTLIANKAFLDELRLQIAEMRLREDALLAQRTAKADEIRALSQRITLLGAIAGVIGCIGAIVLMSKGIVRRVDRLKQAASRLAQGQSLRLAEHATDEIGELSSALEEASRLLTAREEALRESEERFRLLVDGVHDYGIFGLDADGTVVSWNAGAERIKGYRADEIIGQHFSRFYPLEHRDTRPLQEMAQAAAFGRVEDEGWRLRKDGSRFWANVVMTALRDKQGQLRGFSKITRDVTDRKRTEEALLTARRDAERASQAKSEFLSRMSHELRTPLNSVLGFAQILDMDIEDRDMRESLAQILRAGRHLLSLIDEVLDIARIEAGRMELLIEPVGLDDIVTEAIALAAPLAEPKQLTIRVEMEAAGQTIVAVDRRRFLQVLLNLLSNAVKFNRDGGEIRLSAQLLTNTMIAIDIADTGCGIADVDRDRLFKPFERLGADRNATTGTGLGLALSVNLMQAMDGDLFLTESDATGSVFSIHIPVSHAPYAVAEVVKTDEKRAVASGPTGKATVLCIEDNLVNLNLIENLVRRRLKTRIIPAMLGGLGLTLAFEHRPDLVLLDVDLPDMNGLSVLAALRSDPRTQTTPVVVISADATEKTRMLAMEKGATHYMTKPLDVRRLMKTLDEVLT
ncbi:MULTISPECIES: PAS domain S-box protein [Rhizobium/Agrobacterium group]|uniref:histidine kinase n=3 Tax=Rhizobiaceae TaxID=82115 RepID=B9K0X0_ALLAM|nr:PAS domain S-box protein [Agrobacterium vitis]ACM38518.1 Signal transduction histidine kinase [Allorhizobium ampelinum S4]MCF1445684.1 PAS domain S-box protein [Allorhizobium ampelinum]MUO26784.1 PAS domain S-box protein [Agrobacterium vitis]MUO40202.1 PAS domain S-box protein [Agrobacterium vitis]MUP08743.1 PAS domain S-box protein [Agrobacterium vitis]